MQCVYQSNAQKMPDTSGKTLITIPKISRSRIRLTSIAVDDTHLCYLIRLWRLCYMGEACGKRVRIPHGRATVSGDESQQDEPLAGTPLGRRWRVG
jgi:hypothetical protein